MPRLAPFRHLLARQLSQLEDRMQAYYAAVPDYPAFHAPSHNPHEWRHLLAEVRRRRDRGKSVAILEFGAGRSGFPAWLRQQLGSDGSAPLSITCQDVTAANQAYLQ